MDSLQHLILPSLLIRVIEIQKLIGSRIGSCQLFQSYVMSVLLIFRENKTRIPSVVIVYSLYHISFALLRLLKQKGVKFTIIIDEMLTAQAWLCNAKLRRMQ